MGEPFDLQLTLNLEDLTFSMDGQVINRKAETDAERLKPILQGDFQSNKDLILKYLQQRGGFNGWSIQTIAADLNLSIGVTRRDTLKLYTQNEIQRRRMECLGKGRPAYLYYYGSPEKKYSCPPNTVENSQNVDTVGDTNKDHPSTANAPEKNYPCAKNPVENSQDVCPVSDTNKDHHLGNKDQTDEVIFIPATPDINLEAGDTNKDHPPEIKDQVDGVIFNPTPPRSLFKSLAR